MNPGTGVIAVRAVNKFSKFLVGVFQGLLSTLILFIVLEGVCLVVGLPKGASRFTETTILRNNLKLRKAPGEFRIFAYGESTMHGSHYWPVSSPARWLDESLKDFLPGKKIRVVNFARMGRSLDFIHSTVKDTLQYKPDLAIFYAGHNAFLPGNYNDMMLERETKPSARLKELIHESRFISAVYRFVIALKLRKDHWFVEDKIEFETIETPPMGFVPTDFSPKNSKRYTETLAAYEGYLSKITRRLEKENIPVIFFKPVGNLKDFTPAGSIHQKTLTPEQTGEWEKAYQAGLGAQKLGDSEAALGFYKQAYKIDPTYADLPYRMGQIYFKKGELVLAKKFFEEARDTDAMPVRAPRDILNLFESFQKSGKIRWLLDTEKLLASEAPGGILGEPVVEDNVHFSIKGHSILGRALADEIAAQGWIAPRSEWKFENEKPFEEVSRRIGVTDELLFSAFLKCANYFGSRYEMRLNYAQKAALIKPDDINGMRQLAWTYWLKGDKGKAMEVYEQLRQKSPEVLRGILKANPDIQKALRERDVLKPAV